MLAPKNECCQVGLLTSGFDRGLPNQYPAVQLHYFVGESDLDEESVHDDDVMENPAAIVVPGAQPAQPCCSVVLRRLACCFGGLDVHTDLPLPTFDHTQLNQVVEGLAPFVSTGEDALERMTQMVKRSLVKRRRLSDGRYSGNPASFQT